jgi:hypothetical protein
VEEKTQLSNSISLIECQLSEISQSSISLELDGYVLSVTDNLGNIVGLKVLLTCTFYVCVYKHIMDFNLFMYIMLFIVYFRRKC